MHGMKIKVILGADLFLKRDPQKETNSERGE